MKFYIQIEDKGRYIRIPLTKEEVETLYGLCCFSDEDEIKDNNFKIPFRKMMYVVHDVLDRGIVYESDSKSLLTLFI